MSILIAVTILNGVFLMVQSVRVIAVYSTVYSLTKGPKRQLPLHVWLIATSYLIYLAGTSLFLYISVSPSDFRNVRAAVFLVAGTIGQYALWNILSYERRKFTAATDYAAEESE